MRKLLSFALIAFFLGGVCYADTVNGIIDKVDMKKYEIIVNGTIVNVSKALVFTENDMGITKTVNIRDLKDHKGEKAVCYGSVNRENVFSAYKVKVNEGHR